MSIEVKVGQVWRSPSGTELAILRVCEARCEGAAIHGPHAHTAGGEGSLRFFLERCTLVRDALPAPTVPWRAGQRRRVTRDDGTTEGVINRRDGWTGQAGDDYWLLSERNGVTYSVHERMFSVLLEDAPAASVRCGAATAGCNNPREGHPISECYRVPSPTLSVGYAPAVPTPEEVPVIFRGGGSYGIPPMEPAPIRSAGAALPALSREKYQEMLAEMTKRVKRIIDRGVGTNLTRGDLSGRAARADHPGAAAGCHLGCTCPQHRPPREPWVPAVDEWDLLKDA